MVTTVDELLGGARYRDVDVDGLDGSVLRARVDGRPVEVQLPGDLAAEVRSVWAPGVAVLRVAQADPASLPERLPDGSVRHPEAGWLVVADPVIPPPARPLTLAAAPVLPSGYVAGLTPGEVEAFPRLCRLIDEVRSDGGQSSSRNGATVDQCQLHHAATRSVDVVLGMMATGSREVSANLVVGDDGRLFRVTSLLRRAWTSGSASADARAVTIETVNRTGAPSWLIGPEAQATIVAVLAALALDAVYDGSRRSTPGHKDLWNWWGISYPTACPGGMDVDALVERARTGAVPAAPIDMEGDDMTRPLIAMKLDNGPKHGLGVMIEPDGTVVGLNRDQWGFWSGFAGCTPVRCTVSGQWEYLMGVAAARRDRARVKLDDDTVRAIAESVGLQVSGVSAGELAAALADELARRLDG